MDAVRCNCCGLLATRNFQNSLVYPANEHVRKTGRTKVYYDSSIDFGGGPMASGYDAIICFKGYPGLPEDIDETNELKAIQKERSCPYFVAWVPGYTPEKHEEMTLLEQVQSLAAQQRAEELQRSREWRAEDLRWQKQVEALYETRHQENIKEAKSSKIWSITVAIISAAVAFMASIFVGWLFQSGLK